MEAAHELDVTPATVSNHVADLEEDLGAKLFKRQAQGVALNAAGRGNSEPRPTSSEPAAGNGACGLGDGDVVAVPKTSEASTGDIVVARLGDEVTLKRFVQVDERYVELRPESFNPSHQVTKLDLALHILQIEGITVGGLIRKLRGKADGEADQEQERARRTAPDRPT